MLEPTPAMYAAAAAALAAVLGAERYLCEHDFLAHRALDAAWFGPDEQLRRTMAAIRDAEATARAVPHF